MLGLERIRPVIADHAWRWALKRHKSRMGILAAPAYTRYLKRCQNAYREEAEIAPEIRQAAEQFHARGYATLWTPQTEALANSLMAKLTEEQARDADIWDLDGRYKAAEPHSHFAEMHDFLAGQLGELYRAIYHARFKIYYSMIYRSVHSPDGPSGSQLWHADGGPGTCINTMVYLTDVGPEHGVLDCLPWAETLEIFLRERKEMRSRDGRKSRQASAEYYRTEIESKYAGHIAKPTGKAGLIVVFRNNLLHRGGFPNEGYTRHVALFHAYASHKPAPLERYRLEGTPKRGPYPKDPAEDF